MEQSATTSRDTVLQGFEVERKRTEEREETKKVLKLAFRRYRAGQTVAVKNRELLSALRTSYQRVVQRLRDVKGKVNQELTLMEVGAALREIFLAKNDRQFDRRFDLNWRQQW